MKSSIVAPKLRKTAARGTRIQRMILYTLYFMCVIFSFVFILSFVNEGFIGSEYAWHGLASGIICFSIAEYLRSRWKVSELEQQDPNFMHW